MRATMPQLAMWNCLGVELPAHDGMCLAELIRLGHDDLVTELGIDVGYDVHQWHAYLSEFSESDCWADKHITTFPAAILRAASNPAWRDAIRSLVSQHAGEGTAVGRAE